MHCNPTTLSLVLFEDLDVPCILMHTASQMCFQQQRAVWKTGADMSDSYHDAELTRFGSESEFIFSTYF